VGGETKEEGREESRGVETKPAGDNGAKKLGLGAVCGTEGKFKRGGNSHKHGKARTYHGGGGLLTRSGRRTSKGAGGPGGAR